ncbi:hypothetical protein HanRHA438_Chr09g0402721 [Helianthus annuus]|nr:hypothetical protein HanRHA438_Chr09g0402721 [Helianthus annuus]
MHLTIESRRSIVIQNISNGGSMSSLDLMGNKIDDTDLFQVWGVVNKSRTILIHREI